MDVPLEKRCGDQSASRTIHIEHTVPAGVLVQMLRARIESYESPQALHDDLVAHSIGCALSADEEEAVKKDKANVARQTTPCFDGGSRVVASEICPFRRYLPLTHYYGDAFCVYNVFTGEPIDFERFTFRDHQEALRALTGKVLSRLGEKNRAPYSAELFAPECWEHFWPQRPLPDRNRAYLDGFNGGRCLRGAGFPPKGFCGTTPHRNLI